MKKWWATQSARIDGLSLRERVFLFLSLTVVLIALVDTLWLSPARVTHAQLQQQFIKQSGELQRLRDELKAMPPPVDPSAAVSVELALADSRLESLAKSIKEMSALPKSQTPLAQVLVHFLRRYDQLALVRTMTLAADATGTTGAESGSPSPTGAVAAPVVIARQGIELTVAGPYAELIHMVQTLEKAMPTLRWGEMRLAAEKLPPQLTLQVFVVGDNP